MERDKIEKYFYLLKKILIENDLMGKLSNIINNDESKLQLNNYPRNVFFVKGNKGVDDINSAEGWKIITINGCISTEEIYFPPYLKAKNKKCCRERQYATWFYYYSEHQVIISGQKYLLTS